MKGATSIQERLWELRKDKGLNLEELSKLTGISKSALGNYEKEDYKEINHGNLITLADFYGVSIDYLLCRTKNREQVNTPLTELHLSDEMVALLKSGRINNRLLCKLAAQKDFIKFLPEIGCIDIAQSESVSAVNHRSFLAMLYSFKTPFAQRLNSMPHFDFTQ